LVIAVASFSENASRDNAQSLFRLAFYISSERSGLLPVKIILPADLFFGEVTILGIYLEYRIKRLADAERQAGGKERKLPATAFFALTAR
jgi:hypothetical protein